MELFLSWVPAIVLLLVGVVLVRRDPRRLLPGILFGALLFLLLSRVLSLLLGGVGRAIGGELGEAWALLGFILLGAFAVVLLGVGLLWNTFEMVRRERPGPAALVTGAIGLVLLAYVAGGVLALVFDSTVILFDLLLLMPPLAYVGFVFVCFLLYSTVYGWAMRRFGGPVDAVVVLGSGLLGGERISPLLASRLDVGKRVYERSRAEGRQTVLIPSGGRGSDEKLAESEAMARHLVEQGVPGSDIVLEDQSTDTRENLELSRQVMLRHGIRGDVAVATNNYHAFRSATLMRRAGLPGYSIGAPTARYYWPSATVREFLAMLRDNLVINAIVIGLLTVPWIIYMVNRLVSAFQ